MKTTIVPVEEKIEVLTIKGYRDAVPHIRVVKGDKEWDTRISSGLGSLEPWAAENLAALAAEYGEKSVAKAIDALDVYPPKCDTQDKLEIENHILGV
jgi:hypothetical protein